MKLFFPFIFLFFLNIGYSQKTFQGNYNFKNYSIEQGLPSSETYDVEQDNEGNIWFATDRGVVKYDSRTFKTYTKKDGLIDDVVLQIYKDPFGRLWFLTIENQLCYYENGSIKKYIFNHQIVKYSPQRSHPDKDIVIKKNGTLFLSMRPHGFLKIDKNGKVGKINNRFDILNIKKIEDKTIWSLNLIDYLNLYLFIDIFYSTPNHSPIHILKQKFSNNKIITTNDKQSSYLMLANSIYNLDKKLKILDFKNSTLIQIKKIDSDLWVSTYKNGVQIYNVKNKPIFKTTLLKKHSVTDIFKDRNNGYWFSTLEKGVFFIPNLSIQNFSEKDALIHNEIKNINGLNDKIYIGYNGNNYQIIVKNKWSSYKEDAIAYTQFGHAGKSLILTNEKGTFINNLKKTIYWQKDIYSGEKYCVGIGKKISKFYSNNKTIDVTPYYWSLNNIHAIMYDGNDQIWLGGTKGLYQCKNGYIIPYKQNKFNHRVTDLIYSKKWGKLIGTRDGGLFTLSNTKITKIKSRLLSDDISCLFIDNSNKLWIGTNNGINILTKLKSGEIKVSCISKHHGLISNEINSIFVDNNYAWIGTKNGLSKITLNKIKGSNIDTKIKLNSILLNNNKSLDLTKKISIPHFEDIVKIKFGAINFSTKGLYKYRLHSFSKWTYVKIPEIILLNPEDGDYELEVSFLNENNNWSSIQKITNFTIEAPFWRTLYFRLLIGFIIALLIYIFIQFKKRQFETKQKLIILEQKALFAQMNPHFIFNTLNSIQSFLIYNENEKAEFFLAKFSKLLRETLHISRNSSVSLKKEIDILEKYLDLEQMRFSNKFKWEMINHVSNSSQNIRIPNMLIQPYIENSIKHGFIENRFDYKIDIIITQLNENALKCEIIDNGIGRKNSMLKKEKNELQKDHISYGEKITKERLKSYNKSKKIIYKTLFHDLINDLGDSEGTKVEIIIPILKQ